MANLSPQPILGGVDQTLGDLRLRERTELALVSVALPLGAETKAKKALKSAYKLDFPEPGTFTAATDHRLVRMTADQAVLVFANDSPLAEPAVRAALKGSCYTTNQTDAWVVLELSGAKARDALERLCPLDLHDTAFPIGNASRTVMEHMSAVILREADDTWLLMTASSSAKSFLHAVETSIHYTA